MEEKKNYIMPEVEVMEARVERGFAGSNTNTQAQGLSTQQMQGGGEGYHWS